MPEVGSASLAIIPSFKGFQGNLERGVNGPLDGAGRKGGVVYGDSAGKAAAGRFRTTFTRAAKATLLGVAGLGVGAFKLAGDSVKLASDLNESLNAVNVTYGKQAKAVKRLGAEAADSLGLSNSEFNSLSVRFSAFSKTIAGGDGRKVVNTLDDLTTRAADFASVMNLEVNEAAELFQSGLAGETEPLRKYGLDLSAAAVEAYALSEGIVKSKDELDEAAKVQARYGLLMDKTSKAQGDFANTSDSLANRQRILSARWDNARATLGTALLPLLEDLSGWVLDKGIPAFEDFAEWFNGPGIKKIQGFGRFLRDDLAPPLKNAAEFAGDLVGWLDKLPKNVKIGGLAGLAALVGAAKLRGGSGGLGAAGKALGLAKPVPVFVTNPGFGTGTTPAGSPRKPGVVGTAGKLLGPLGLILGAGYLGWEVNSRLNDKRQAMPTEPGASGSKEHATILRNWEGAEGAVSDYNRGLERTRDNLLTITNGVTGFSSKAERARDKVLGITNGLVGTQRETDKARTKVGLLADALDRLDGRTVTTYFNPVSAKADVPLSQLIGRAGGGHMRAGTTYLVGERGPETFTPYAPGRMTPAHQAAPSGGGEIVFDFRGSVIQPRDYDHFMSDMNKRRDRAALEGRRGG